MSVPSLVRYARLQSVRPGTVTLPMPKRDMIWVCEKFYKSTEDCRGEQILRSMGVITCASLFIYNENSGCACLYHAPSGGIDGGVIKEIFDKLGIDSGDSDMMKKIFAAIAHNKNYQDDVYQNTLVELHQEWKIPKQNMVDMITQYYDMAIDKDCLVSF